MTIAVQTPDSHWKRARLLTASPSPPLRANGANSATRCTTRTPRPSAVRSGETAGGVGDGESADASRGADAAGFGLRTSCPSCAFMLLPDLDVEKCVRTRYLTPIHDARAGAPGSSSSHLQFSWSGKRYLRAMSATRSS